MVIDKITHACRCGAKVTMKLGPRWNKPIGWTFVVLRMQEEPTVAETPLGKIETGDMAKLGHYVFCPECGVDVWKFFAEKP